VDRLSAPPLPPPGLQERLPGALGVRNLHRIAAVAVGPLTPLLGPLLLLPGLLAQPPRLLGLPRPVVAAAGVLLQRRGLLVELSGHLLGLLRLRLRLFGPLLQLGPPFRPRLLVLQLRQLAGVVQVRLDVLQLLLGQAVQLLRHLRHPVHGVGVGQAVLPERLLEPVQLGPQPLAVVADPLADLLLQLLRLGQLGRLLLPLLRQLLLLLRLLPQLGGPLLVLLLLGLGRGLLGLLVLVRRLQLRPLRLGLGLGRLALRQHLAALAEALLD